MKGGAQTVSALIGGKPVTGLDTRFGFLFQRDALLPWRSVYDNVALGPRLRKQPEAHVREQVMDWLARVGLRGFEHH